MKVAVLDTNKQLLAPCHPAMARKLLSRGEAAMFRRAPFTIILKREVSDVQTPDLQLKIDPGSKVTGMAIVNRQTGEVVSALEIEHRGHAIKKSLDERRGFRHCRRQRKTRYRKSRFKNRGRRKGFLPPSLESRVENIYTWAQRLRRVYPIRGIAMELVKFDRTRRGLPKAHWIDAACVGHSTPEKLDTTKIKPLRVKAVGHNSRQMCRMDKYGFPRTSAKATRTVNGFRTGDLVKAVVPKGKKQGVHVGKVAVRSSGSFNIVTAQGTIQGVSYRYCHSLHRADGYSITG